MKKLLLLTAMTAFLGFSGNFCLALDVNKKMGKPTNEELSMTEYAPDPEAEAVVLYSSTDVRYIVRNRSFMVQTHYKKRIKILKEDGKSEGDISIVVYDAEDGIKDVLSGLKGNTYNLNNGQVVKSKLNADLKNEQRLDQNYVVKKISMPNVMVGSVLELEYEITSEDYSTIDTWYAQEDIPVFFTEYDIVVPEWFTMRTNQTGRAPLTAKREETNYVTTVGSGVLSASATAEHFEGHEMPRIKEDSYIMCLKDYMTKVTKELTNITVPGFLYQSYNQDWSHELGDLMESSYFGRLCKHNTPFTFKWTGDSAWPEDFTVKQKIDSLRNLLWSQYDWNESYNLYARNIRNLDKEKSGNSATLNFALMNMLNEAGVPTYPVVMSRRSKGRLPIMPSRKHLNAMVLCSLDPADSTYIYFDAGSKDYPVGVIPSDFLAQKAFVLNPEIKKFQTKNLENVCKGSKICSLNLAISNEGLMTGSSSSNHRGLGAARFRQQFRQAKDQEEYIRNLSATADIEIEDYQIRNLSNSQESVVESYSLSKQLDIENDRMYVNPFIGFEFASAFRDETRDLPVEMPYNTTQKISVNLQLPDGYEVEEMPKGLNLKLPDGTITSRMGFQQAGQTVRITYNFNRTATFFDVSQYVLLRNCYSAIEQAGNERIVLKKKQ